MKRVAKVYKKVISILAYIVCFTTLLDCLKYIIKENKLITFIDSISNNISDICITVMVVTALFIIICDIVDSIKKQKLKAILDYILGVFFVSSFFSVLSIIDNEKINYYFVIFYTSVLLVILGNVDFLLKYGIERCYNLGLKDVIENFIKVIMEKPSYNGPKDYDNQIGKGININFRKCRERDLTFIYELREDGFKWYLKNLIGWDETQQKEIILNEMAEHLDDMKIIQYEGKDVGLFTFYLDSNGDGFIDMLAISPEYRNKGIGSEILDYLISTYPNTRLYLRTYKQNPARKLYMRFGFVIYDETEDNWLMERVEK